MRYLVILTLLLTGCDLSALPVGVQNDLNALEATASATIGRDLQQNASVPTPSPTIAPATASSTLHVLDELGADRVEGAQQ